MTDYQNHEKVSLKELRKNGFFARFEDGQNIIEVQTNKWGKETITLNGHVVSEKRNFTSRRTLHQFVFDGTEYEVEVYGADLLKGELHIIVIKDGAHLETQKFIVQEHINAKGLGKTFWSYFVIGGFVGGFAGYVGAYYFDKGHLPEGLSRTIELVLSWFG